ncbi:hypothetical protein QVD17_30681 [Tagetes erecta]|uniref:Uncharacterized protein n=1 Tax=Tagetes erecta TaxID=13708 RepID=A0AAD8NNL9_TARER|nr:hypothetical protein QVD17_30681 [Tagetes erecta]
MRAICSDFRRPKQLAMVVSMLKDCGDYQGCADSWILATYCFNRRFRVDIFASIVAGNAFQASAKGTEERYVYSRLSDDHITNGSLKLTSFYCSWNLGEMYMLIRVRLMINDIAISIRSRSTPSRNDWLNSTHYKCPSCTTLSAWDMLSGTLATEGDE